MPDEKLMTKWLPSVRWGSLEFEHPNDPKPSPSLIRLDHGQGLQAWMNQSTLRNVLEAEGTSWIAAADYYRFPHVQYFHSVASLVQQLQSLSPATVATSMRRASQKIQSQTLAAHRQVLQHVLGFGHIYDSSDSSDSSCSFANILGVLRLSVKLHRSYIWTYWLDMIGLFATRGSRQLSKLRGNWNQMQLGGTCKNGFITQADFLAAGNSSLRFGGFLKWRYPCSSSILIGFSDFSIINQAFWSSNWGFSISGNSHLGSAVLISNDRSKEPKSSPQVGLHQCLRLCDETAGCEVAVSNSAWRN